MAQIPSLEMSISTVRAQVIATYLNPSRASVKNTWSYNSTPSYVVVFN